LTIFIFAIDIPSSMTIRLVFPFYFWAPFYTTSLIWGIAAAIVVSFVLFLAYDLRGFVSKSSGGSFMRMAPMARFTWWRIGSVEPRTYSFQIFYI